jgi:hypothetical protein
MVLLPWCGGFVEGRLVLWFGEDGEVFSLTIASRFSSFNLINAITSFCLLNTVCRYHTKE